MICSKKYVDETLKEHHLIANKALGQNFLVEESIAKEIVDSANLTSSSLVIEIGPGLGALTQYALLNAKKVIAFEIDANMVNILKQTFQNYMNFNIYNIDFLEVDLTQLFQKLNLQEYDQIVLLSNLPYYITSKILNRLIYNNISIEKFIVMMQKEVGLKLLKPSKKEYNMLSVLLDYQYQTEIVKYVGKNSYLPRPEIDSIVLKISKITPRFANVDFKSLIFVCDKLFSQRRKTIYNNLKDIFQDKNELEMQLNRVNLSLSHRVEQLSIEDIMHIVIIYQNNHLAQ